MECHFCGNQATHIKKEAEYSYNEEAIEKKEIVELPICKPCNEENYDGTEEYPRMRKI